VFICEHNYEDTILELNIRENGVGDLRGAVGEYRKFLYFLLCDEANTVAMDMASRHLHSNIEQYGGFSAMQQYKSTLLNSLLRYHCGGPLRHHPIPPSNRTSITAS